LHIEIDPFVSLLSVVLLMMREKNDAAVSTTVKARRREIRLFRIYTTKSVKNYV